jgi:cytochrome b subunit of formate dehydrogenase
MSYEYNTKDADLELPNPYKLENFFLLLSALILFGGGISVTLTARAFMQAEEVKVATAAMLLALLLFAASSKFAIQALSQMRFYYGRQFPVGLAEQLSVSATGTGKGAKDVMEIMRQRAIAFPEPSGPLNGVIYALCKGLITCPPQIQNAAVQHFHSLVGMTALFGSLAVSYSVFEGSEHEGVISWIYLPLTGVSLITPFVQKRLTVVQSSHSTKMLWSLVALVAFVILAPVLVPRYVPAFPIPPMWVVPAVVLACSMVASFTFLLSLLHKIDDVRDTSVSCEQTTIAMNCPPSQLWTEIGRDFQNNWTREIPNKTYANVPPDISAADRGSFNGYVLEESHPIPAGHMAFRSLSEAWKEKHARYLILLSMWGMLMSIISVSVAVKYIDGFLDMTRMEISRILLVVIALGVANVLAFQIGHLLWSRMYFKSRLTWIEVSGTFQTSHLNIGNTYVGKSQSSSTLTRVEDATLRVWVTDIVSVAFGKESNRCIMTLKAADGIAKSTAHRLIDFAANQSSITTPMSRRDLERVATMGALEASIQAETGASITKMNAQLAKQCELPV